MIPTLSGSSGFELNGASGTLLDGRTEPRPLVGDPEPGILRGNTDRSGVGVEVPQIQGGFNSGDGWVAVNANAGFVTSNPTPFEGDQAAFLQIGLTPTGILRRDYAPAIDLSGVAELRVLAALDPFPGNADITLILYSDGLSNSVTVALDQGDKGNTIDGSWGVSFSERFGPGVGTLDWSAIERIEITLVLIGPLFNPFFVYLDLLGMQRGLAPLDGKTGIGALLGMGED